MDKPKEIHQPTQPEDVSKEQKAAIKREVQENENLVLNPGDRTADDGSKTLEEKAQKVAVDAPDITGDHIVVPTYFVVEDEDGEQKALHHVRDAEEISDVIRQARTNEEGDRTWW
ncbi:MAG: hypothetical protein VKK04_22595 [Synechococcales bacterium]|nr:hypothetical protein [Synechococcales bacterium]